MKKTQIKAQLKAEKDAQLALRRRLGTPEAGSLHLRVVCPSGRLTAASCQPQAKAFCGWFSPHWGWGVGVGRTSRGCLDTSSPGKRPVFHAVLLATKASHWGGKYLIYFLIVPWGFWQEQRLKEAHLAKDREVAGVPSCATTSLASLFAYQGGNLLPASKGANTCTPRMSFHPPGSPTRTSSGHG